MATTKRGFRPALLLIACGLAPAGAFAADGVREINDTCAVRTGCFPGDSAGYPVTIGSAGSYLLTGNLTTGSRALSAIEITSSDVTLDLGGFTIACAFGTVLPLGCLSAGGGIGVDVSSATARRITIRSGVVQGMGADGVRVRSGSRVVDLVVSNNGGNGIVLGSGSIAHGNLVTDNVGFGLLFSAALLEPDGYRDNAMTGNTMGPVGGTASNLGGNLCGASVCP